MSVVSRLRAMGQPYFVETPANDPYYVEGARPERVLVVTGRWSAEIGEILARGEVDALELNMSRGFRQRDLEFIEPWPLKWLLLLDGRIDDLTPIERLSGTLEQLLVSEAGPRVELELDEYPMLWDVSGEWSMLRRSLSRGQGRDLRVLWASGFDERDFSGLGHLRKLEHLKLFSPGRLASLEGVAALVALADLRLSHARRLDDLSELVAIRDSIRHLELESCRGFRSLDPVGELRQLRLLSVADCGDIDSFEPLRALERLESLWAWESTRVLDGDLSPLAELPQLRELKMMNRRSYRPQVPELQAVIADRYPTNRRMTSE